VTGRRRVALTLACLIAPLASPMAQTPASSLPDIVVRAPSLPGTAVAPEDLAGEVHSVDAAGLRGAAALGVGEALASRVASISLEDSLGDAFQPTLSYRGFTASPVLGTGQGLAVYQNGVRLNEAFGDVVNWDLVPMAAVRRIDVVSANPLYGANALGGAVVMTLKNGLTDPGVGADVAAGSFGARAATLEAGGAHGPVALYVEAHALDDGGYQRRADNRLRQLYGDLRVTGARGSLALGLTSAHDVLDGPGAVPIQSLAIDPRLTFTGPQRTDNRLDLVTLNGEFVLSAATTVTGVAYRRDFRQSLLNGNTTGYMACTDQAGVLCQADGSTVVAGHDGIALPDLSLGGTRPLGENDAAMEHTRTVGGTVQLAGRLSGGGLTHALALGASVDDGRIDFGSDVWVSTLDGQLQVQTPGLYVSTPEGSAFRATPIRLAARNRSWTTFVSDALALTPTLTVTASARDTRDTIELSDRVGTALTGTSRFHRLNPALGATYRTTAGAVLYVGYAETTRAPTPSEIECSDPLRPCLLPSTLAGDPPTLREVVARTWEAGLRQSTGVLGTPGLGLSASVFRVRASDDIYAVATASGAGYFQNIEATLREGASASLDYHGSRWSGAVGVSLLRATFDSTLTLRSPQNPHADPEGNIRVTAGDVLPGIPARRMTLLVDWRATSQFTVGGTAVVVGPVRYHGDESNRIAPLGGYTRLDLHATLAAGTRVEWTLSITNLFDARYAGYGLLADPTGVGAPGVPTTAAADPRFQSLGLPRTLRLALRLRY
jgi:iron complex outermembrane recepter protein